MSEKLKPCPFCGSEQIVLGCQYGESNYDRAYSIVCKNCGARSKKFTQSITSDDMTPIDNAHDAWNTRPVQYNITEHLKKLELEFDSLKQELKGFRLLARILRRID